MTNLAGNSEYRNKIAVLATALLNYAEKYSDPNLPQGHLRASLEEVMNG